MAGPEGISIYVINTTTFHFTSSFSKMGTTLIKLPNQIHNCIGEPFHDSLYYKMKKTLESCLEM